MPYVFLLLVDMPDLEPDIRMSQRTRRIAQDLVETPEAVLVLGLLLVNYPQTEQDFVRLVEVCLTPEMNAPDSDRRKRIDLLLSMASTDVKASSA